MRYVWECMGMRMRLCDCLAGSDGYACAIISRRPVGSLRGVSDEFDVTSGWMLSLRWRLDWVADGSLGSKITT